MNQLFYGGLEYVGAYVDDLLIISNVNFDSHLNRVKKGLKKHKAAGFKINEEKSFLAKDNLEYHDCKMTRQGIISLPDKVQVIKCIHGTVILTSLPNMTYKQGTWSRIK